MLVNKWIGLVVAVIICEGAGILGAFFTTSAIPNWYATLIRPVLAPPNWIFGPVWTTLYLLMGIAVWLVWQRGWQRSDVKKAVGVFAVQLVLNSVWSIIFFGMQNPGLALLEIAAMWLAIVWTIVLFYRISKPAAYLLLPYLLWVSFASYLNYAIWALN
ncbi:MAG: TspO/MBR family protein [Candidatus Andersenbacteria bacterium]|nr:TspO/MBR family protein [bacterium]MDZ4225846.1 TspO/MBR family protein [Candidatus Andersenbacteria bacterium]